MTLWMPPVGRFFLSVAALLAIICITAAIWLIFFREYDYDILAAAWPWACVLWLSAYLFGKFLITINRAWWSLTPEERAKWRSMDDSGW